MEGNAADGLVSLAYRQDTVRKMIFYRGLAAGAHGVSLPNVYVRYNDTTQIKALLPGLFADSVRAATLVDISSTTRQLLVADSLVLHVYGGDRFAPKGEDSTGNLTRVRLLLRQPCREEVRLAYHHKEVPVYGSDRVGQYTPDSLVYRSAVAGVQADMVVAAASAGYAYRETGLKQYELKDHLGNVRVVVGDEKLADVSVVVRAPGDTLVSLYLRAGVRSQSNYYPFGMTQPGGSYVAQGAEGYRYGFNGKEKDTEGIGGGGSTYDYGFRIYNPQLAKFLSTDPLAPDYPWLSPYQFASLNPIVNIDVDGLEGAYHKVAEKVTLLKLLNALGTRAQARKAARAANNLPAEQTGNNSPAVTTTSTSAVTTSTLGSLSEAEESAGRGPGTVSSGKGDRGGASYGVYQLSSKLGRVNEFLAVEGAEWADSFKGLQPGTEDFNKVWKKIAAEESENFRSAQHSYIERTHYEVSKSNILKQTGLNVDSYSDVMKDVLWSTSVQHGPYNKVFKNALAGKDLSKLTEAQIIEAIYDERGRMKDDKLVYFTSANASWKTSLQNRFKREKKAALAKLKTE